MTSRTLHNAAILRE